ncbi:MAG: 4-(cytidine 5'-diphospho)-2-C-methyl-D-erythritol kinase [Acidimicrobiia bacterium]|nr:4-(cytidine 5'-diphospho)-2-C-methyl-D-erythritol kinase [Acidimicrobiia bacterium]
MTAPLIPEEGMYWEAPAKINLDVRVRPPRGDGMHPIRSHAQTITHCDLVRFESAEEDRLVVKGSDLEANADNLVTSALAGIRGNSTVPPVSIELTKNIPHRAGLGGGSSDAAAVIRALMGNGDDAQAVAAAVGADVSFFLDGGLCLMEGIGERVSQLDVIDGYAVAVVMPGYGLTTADVYARWDELHFPEGTPVDGPGIPPGLRELGPLVNDLVPAAVSLRPDLGDWMADLDRRWGRPVLMSGSGSACFAFFADIDEAASALDEVESSDGFVATPRPFGVASWIRNG